MSSQGEALVPQMIAVDQIRPSRQQVRSRFDASRAAIIFNNPFIRSSLPLLVDDRSLALPLAPFNFP